MSLMHEDEQKAKVTSMILDGPLMQENDHGTQVTQGGLG